MTICAKHIIVLPVICILLIVSACDVVVHSPPKSIEIYRDLIKRSDDICYFEIGEDSKISQYIMQILQKENKDWKPSFTTYLPYIQMVSGDRTYTLNVMPELLVANVRSKGSDKARQVTKTVPASVYEDLKAIIKAEDVFLKSCGKGQKKP